MPLSRLPDGLLRQSGGKTELLIRRGFPGEFVSMAALAVRAWRIAARDIELTTERQEVLEARFQHDLQEIADGVLVAEKAGILAGWGARVPQSNYISDLWVDPPHHGQGIGRQILDALMAQILLDGFDEALIGTHADNMPAINLYKRLVSGSTGKEMSGRKVSEEPSRKSGCALIFEGLLTATVAECSIAPILPWSGQHQEEGKRCGSC